MALEYNFVPQTELDAVNQMLMSIGQAPLDTLDVVGIKDVAFAKVTLHNTLREVLNEGWDFNSDYEYEIAPDGDGFIIIPDTALSIDPSDTTLDYVERFNAAAGADGSRVMYDRMNQADDEFTDAVKFDVHWFFEFEHIPQAARSFIAHKAGRIFQANHIGSQLIYQFTKERELETRANLERQHGMTLDANLFNAPTAAGRIANRQYGPYRRW